MSTATGHTAPEAIGIAAMSELSGLSQDTLRWYEREGLIPRVDRSHGQRRAFSPRVAALVQLLVRLRESGMPSRVMREFVRLVEAGSQTHRERVEILEAHRTRLADQERRIIECREALEAKIDHYRGLIAAGLDCDGAPIALTDTEESCT